MLHTPNPRPKPVVKKAHNWRLTPIHVSVLQAGDLAKFVVRITDPKGTERIYLEVSKSDVFLAVFCRPWQLLLWAVNAGVTQGPCG